MWGHRPVTLYFLSDAIKLAQTHSGHTEEGKGRKEGEEGKETFPQMEDDLENDLSNEEVLVRWRSREGHWRQREEHLQSRRGLRRG